MIDKEKDKDKKIYSNIVTFLAYFQIKRRLEKIK